jgi:hypothetical protein
MKTYQMAECASGCAYHSTVGGVCGMCQGPLTAPQTVTREQAREILLGGKRYDQGKADVLAWMEGAR